MDDVAAALGDQGNLGPGSPAEIGAGVRRDSAKLLHGIERDPEDAGKSGMVLLIVDVDSVERDIGLIALTAVYGSAPEVVLLGRIGLAKVGDARLQREQTDHVAGFERQLSDRLVSDGVADGSVRCVQ